MNYKTVISKMGEPINKNTDYNLIYTVDKKENEEKFEIGFVRADGHYYINGDLNKDLINEIIINLQIKNNYNQEAWLDYVNKNFLKGTAKFKLTKKEVNEQFKNIVIYKYESDNIGKLKNVGKISVTMFTDNGNIRNITLTSSNM